MVVVGIALGLVTGLLLLNLLLDFGIIRRLREQDSRLTILESDRPRSYSGAEVTEFTTTTTRGDKLTADWFRDRSSLVAFLTHGCPACHEEIPALADHLAGTDRQALVVVAAMPGDEPEELPAAVTDRATVVEEPLDGPLLSVFGVHEFPVFMVIGPESKVVADDNTLAGMTAQLPPR